jgi:hypothetical protein
MLPLIITEETIAARSSRQPSSPQIADTTRPTAQPAAAASVGVTQPA